MKVTNNSNGDIQVAISRWGDNDQKASFFTLKRGEDGNWSRSDSKGFLMAISSNYPTTNGTYFIKSTSNIDVGTNQVSRDGTTINKLQ
ncbi:MAG: hypothetical protein AB8E82_17665 [Aureispira sp.]